MIVGVEEAPPAWTAGTHAVIELPDGLVRHYPLTSDPAEQGTWMLAVLRKDDGRGESRFVHDQMAVGSVVRVQPPDKSARKALRSAFRAARIGVTFPQHENLDVCRIEDGPVVEAQFVSLPDRGGSVAERFFVRSGNSTQELTPSQMHLYVGQRFPRRK